ncbi:Zinc transporter ZIP12 [Hondaea fermentalgiana]|uniref:Zinc transporter ZIP12 n=1 Tax=Hondaea fermentalgiana TaxID=2315210 RepID=A0A2R5GVZ1_9STRA|nr:Zinc transporter ZIP12 [Hondaea fermentalgiana]|eukprot:GBG32581.1 Zinc transporter ZIP12 [Hondaea fermentalgiana]
MIKFSASVAAIAVLALATGAQAQASSDVAACTPAIDRFIVFMEAEAALHSNETSDEEDHDHDHDDEEVEYLLSTVSCTSDSMTVLYEDHEYVIDLDEYTSDCDFDGHCEMFVCEDDHLHLNRYHGCCADVATNETAEATCHVVREEEEEEVSTTCTAALEHLVAFLEEEHEHEHDHEYEEEEEEEEDDHDHDHDHYSAEVEYLLETVSCSNDTMIVLFEEEQMEVHLDEYEWDGCTEETDNEHCERLVCEDGHLHLNRYHGCCSDLTATSEPEEECTVQLEASESESESSTSTNAAVWGKTLAATVVAALTSLVGVFLIIGKRKSLNTNIMNDVSALAIGFLLSTVFIHLLPESTESVDFGWKTGTAFLGGVVTALFIQMGTSIIGLDHTHSTTAIVEADGRGKVDMEGQEDGSIDGAVDLPLVYNIIIGDGIHNLVDGMLIAIGFAACPTSAIGWITLASVVMHEIPQELVDFVILVRAGLSFKAALFFNFCSQLTCVVGAIIVLALNASIDETAQAYVLVYGAGFLAYVALAELVPSIVNIDSKSRRFFRMFLIVLGAVVIGVFGLFHEHCHAEGDDHDHDH